MQIAQSTLGDKEAIQAYKCVGPKRAPGSWVTWGTLGPARQGQGRPHSSGPFFCPLLVGYLAY